MDTDENIGDYLSRIAPSIPMRQNPLSYSKGNPKNVFVKKSEFKEALQIKNKQVIKPHLVTNDLTDSTKKVDKPSTLISQITIASLETLPNLMQRKLPRETKYLTEKEKCTYRNTIHEAFHKRSFMEDYNFTLRPKLKYTTTAYKNIISNICEGKITQYSKDLSRFGNKKTLCLGLDDILIKISTNTEDCDASVPIYLNDEVLISNLSIKYRPFLFEFLDDMASKYELILYSSLNSYYINAIISKIPQLGKYFNHIFGEEFCVFSNIEYGVKFLDFLLSNRTIESIVLADKTIKTLPNFPHNFVPVQPFDEDKDDLELVKLGYSIDYIMQEKNSKNAIYDIIRKM